MVNLTVMLELTILQRVRETTLPHPFPIPAFRKSAQNDLDSGEALTSTDRKYVTQTLATLLLTYCQQPSLSQCGEVAKALISKYAFLKDDEGDGEVSNVSLCHYIL